MGIFQREIYLCLLWRQKHCVLYLYFANFLCTFLQIFREFFSEFGDLRVDHIGTVGLIGVISIEVLMIVCRDIEFLESPKLCDDGSCERSMSLEIVDIRLRDCEVFLGSKYHTAILYPWIRTLAVTSRRIVRGEKYWKECLVRDDISIVEDLDDFDVTASPHGDLVISRILCRATHISWVDFCHSLESPEHRFHTPEASSTEIRMYEVRHR